MDKSSSWHFHRVFAPTKPKTMLGPYKVAARPLSGVAIHIWMM